MLPFESLVMAQHLSQVLQTKLKVTKTYTGDQKTSWGQVNLCDVIKI